VAEGAFGHVVRWSHAQVNLRGVWHSPVCPGSRADEDVPAGHMHLHMHRVAHRVAHRAHPSRRQRRSSHVSELCKVGP